jgi:uncharacterized membrane protein YhhN
MKKQEIAIFYFLTGICYIILQNRLPFTIAALLKALIIPLLILLFLFNSDHLKNRLHVYMLAGLIFSWAGDVILEFAVKNGDLFVPGLISFLLAHVMYIIVFVSTKGKNSFAGSRILLLVPVLIYGIALVSFLYAGLGAMRVPVIVYAAVILTMLSAAINRREKVNKKSYWLVLIGAILFVISDSVIAVNKFCTVFPQAGTLIMATYIIAQYLIVTGYIRQFEKPVTSQIIL